MEEGQFLVGGRDFQHPRIERHAQYEHHTDEHIPSFTIPRKAVASNRSIPVIDYDDGPEKSFTGNLAKRRLHLLQHWWMELVACVLFLMALLAIVATLYPHVGNPLPQWPFRISINALVSVYASVMKAAIIFVVAEGIGQLKWTWVKRGRPLRDIGTYDMASRGVLGSLKLLWRLRLYRHPLACCAALVTIGMVAIDPIAQLIIHYEDCQVPEQSLQATLPRTNIWLGDGIHNGALEQSVSSGMQSAINSGLFAPGQDVDPQCLTGNCTFNHEYSTLAFCSRCEDVSQDLLFRNQTFTEVSDNITSKVELLTATLPSGLQLVQPDPARSMLATMWVPDTGTQRVEIITGMEYGLLEIPQDVCDNPAIKNTWRCKGYGAASCELYPCVESYKAAIVAGKFEESKVPNTFLSSWIQWGEASPDVGPMYATIDTTCISPREREALTRVGYRLDSNTRWLPYNLTWVAYNTTDMWDPRNSVPIDAPFPQSLVARNCLYTFSYESVSSLWVSYFSSAFNGTVDGYYTEAGLTLWTGPQNLQTIYNFGNITLDRVGSIFANISHSMTTYIRQHSIANQSAPAVGLVLHDQTCLAVRWRWLAYPGVLVLVTLVFFIVMVVNTRPTGERAQIWKSEPLALIFHGLDKPHLHIRDRDEVSDVQGMNRVASRIYVRLGRTDHGIGLAQVEGKGESLDD